MICADHLNTAVLVELTAQATDRHVGRQKILRRDRPETTDVLGTDDLKLPIEVAAAVLGLVGQGIAIAGWAAFERVEDVNVLALQRARFNNFVQ